MRFEFEKAACLRDELKRLKLLDLEFADGLMTEPGEAEPARLRRQARAEAEERLRKGAVRHFCWRIRILRLHTVTH